MKEINEEIVFPYLFHYYDRQVAKQTQQCE